MKQKTMMKEIADKAGVSVTTVLNVMHGRREKVSAATFDNIERLVSVYDYRPNIRASLLAGKKDRLVAVLDFRRAEMGAGEDRYLQLRTIIEEIYANGQYALLYFPENQEEGICYAKAWGVDGILTLGISEQKESEIAAACSCKIVKHEGIHKD